MRGTLINRFTRVCNLLLYIYFSIIMGNYGCFRERPQFTIDFLFVYTDTICMETLIKSQLDIALKIVWARRARILRRLLKETAENADGLSRRAISAATPEQYTILTILASFGHGVTVGEIAERLELPHANISRTLDRLERKGLISRTRDRRDKRHMIIRLTLEGGKIARLFSEVATRLNDELWSSYTSEEKLTLLGLLSRQRTAE